MCVSAGGGTSQPGRLCKCDLKGGTYLCLFPLLTRSSMSRMGVARSCSRLFSGDTDRSKHTPFGPLSPLTSGWNSSYEAAEGVVTPRRSLRAGLGCPATWSLTGENP